MPSILASISAHPLRQYLRPGSVIVLCGPSGCGEGVLGEWLAKQAPEVIYQDHIDLQLHAPPEVWRSALHEFKRKVVLRGAVGLLSINVNDEGKDLTLTSRGMPRVIAEQASLVLGVSGRDGLRRAYSLKARHTEKFEFTFTTKAAA